MGKPLRVLLVGSHLAMIRRALQESGLACEVAEAGDPTSALVQVKGSAFDCVLVDEDALEWIKRDWNGATLVLTSSDRSEIEDSVPLSRLNGDMLDRALRFAIERHRLTRQGLESQGRLRNTLQDPVTGLLNQQGLARVMLQEMRRSDRSGESISAILVKIDEFDRAVERIGAAAGDLVLQEAAKVLQRSIRPFDHAAWIENGRFIVLLPDTRTAEARRVADRLRAGLAQIHLELTGAPTCVSADIGVATIPSDVASIHQVLFQTHFESQPPLTEDEQARLARQVVSGDLLRAVTLPIMSLDDDRVVGHEVLTRGPAGRFEMPTELFDLCARQNVLTQVDLRCFKRGLETGSALPGRLHVNLFPATLLALGPASLIQAVPQPLRKGGVVVELSEQQIIGEPSYLCDAVRELRAAGLEVALDDVGFARSSVEALVVLRPDIAKVDRPMVQGVASQVRKQRYLKRLIAVVESLNMRFIAKGVETQEDLKCLRQMGVHTAEGFLWGPPVTF